MKRVLAIVVCLLSAAAFAQVTPQAAEDRRLLEFLDTAFDEAVAAHPEALTALGIKRHYDRLDDYTDAGVKKDLRLAERQVARMLREFDYERLGPDARLSYRLFEKALEDQRRDARWVTHQFRVSNSSSPTSEIPAFLINQHRVDSVQDAQDYVARLRDVERVMREVSSALGAHAAAGVIAPKFVFAPVIADARKVLRGAPFADGPDSAVYADFKAKVAKLDAPGATKTRLTADARAALTGPYKRGYERVIETLMQLDSQARGNDGAWSLPDGAAYYADALKSETTTDLTPEQIHQTGLQEVARIHREMQAIMDRLGFEGSLQEFFTRLKTGAEFHYPNSDAGKQMYLEDAQRYIDRLLEKAPAMFRTLPKAKLDVRAVEPWRQETAPVAFYNTPAPDGSRPGIYYVNLADMAQVLKPQIEGITYHEAAPGHHFQIALAQELQGLPKFRRFGSYGAYAEGWGLYAERLGKEMGFYQDPYADFGRLSLELWRAMRLVTDTGLHAKRWSREQAIEYFKQNSLLSDRDVVKEVERYLVWPGQATSYKVGQLEILRLRAKAERELGERFDIRDFHAVVLEHGALPLDVLAEQVDAYIAANAPK